MATPKITTCFKSTILPANFPQTRRRKYGVYLLPAKTYGTRPREFHVRSQHRQMDQIWVTAAGAVEEQSRIPGTAMAMGPDSNEQGVARTGCLTAIQQLVIVK